MAARGENKMIWHKLVNAYLSSIVSISLMLLFIGLAALLLVNAGEVSDYFKENMRISVLMKQEVTESQVGEYLGGLEKLPFVLNSKLVTKEEGTADLKAMLGEDFLSVFETSPVPVSVELSLTAAYVSPDSLAFVLPMLSDSPLVDEVDCQSSLVEALNSNLARISLILGVMVLLMLFISFVLINNTVRINVYARRFTVQAMKLVGATRSFIRRPFMKGALWQGLISAFLALCFLAVILWLLYRSFPQMFGIFTVPGLVKVGAVVLLCGVSVCLVSTYFVVNKLVSMHKDDLYY